ncbi:MAG: hypothetical protein AVDCRST_MAG49-4194 [uncultured Thermomicrobiales bacterium]|uniref:Uncharacterized protein n=1 Tax=uncultured Thermomicrobiales bacterium TaxID=1645740 RepID=A0A6J4VFK1_9BACT|nr:MAG: hypothetical protein AVDCRST_MAG49-4194 [uncultured Thermomicrobiales bacterium]
MASTAMTLFWRPFPVATLTVRQFLGGKAVRIVTVLAFAPAIYALIYLVNSDWVTPFEFLSDRVFIDLVSPTLLPITVLILATGALGNEVEDRTLPYLTLKPIGRLRIVLEKLAGVLVVALPIVLAGLVATWALTERAELPARLQGRVAEPDLTPVLWASLAAAAVEVVVFSALFLMVSLYVARALLVGMIYAFVWESILGRFLPGIRLISVRQYVQSVFVGVLDDPTVTVPNAFSLTSALVTMAITCVVAILLATRRLRRMNLE